MNRKKFNSKKPTTRKEKDLQKKQKQQKTIAILLIAIVILAIAGGIAYTVYEDKMQEKAQQEAIDTSRKNTNSSTVNVNPILDYLSGIDTELLNEEISPVVEDTTTEAISAE